MWPQIKQLLIAKQSDELSLPTWLAWTVCQVVSLVYSIALHALPFMVANIAWVTFYLAMLCLIIKYRKKTSLVLAEVKLKEQTDSTLLSVSDSAK
jgi:uncharacterized protein with PQ loop repeat